MYGPADVKWGAWEDVPANRRKWYADMLPRLQAEQVTSLLSAMLASNGRGMSDKDRREYISNLNSDPDEQKPAKVTPGMLRRINAAARQGARRARGR